MNIRSFRRHVIKNIKAYKAKNPPVMTDILSEKQADEIVAYHKQKQQEKVKEGQNGRHAEMGVGFPGSNDSL